MSLKIGWIGCGRHAGEMLLPQLVRTEVELAALCDLDRERLERTGRRYGVSRLTTNADELLAWSGLDAVGMAAGPEEHRALGIKAVDRGLPVFMEKPPAATAAEARQLAAAARKAGKPVIVGFMKRYSVGNRIAKNIIASGRFGKVWGLTGHYLTAPGYFAGQTGYSGFFLHHCIHWLDLVAHLVAPICNISARKVEAQPGKILLHAGFDFENGAIGTVAMGTLQSRGTPCERIDLMGDHCRLEIDNVIDVRFHRDPPFKTGDPDATLADSTDTLSWRPNFTAAANEDHKGYHGLLADTVSALAGCSSGAPTIDDAVVAMEWLEKLRAQI